MKINFTTNDYLLTWNMLFGASISLESHQFKQKLWSAYKNQYHAIENDKDELLKDYKNFIPDDDTIYNLLFETKLFEDVKKNAKKNKINIMQVYDHNKKRIDKYLKEILKIETEDTYNVLVLDPNMDTVLKIDESLNLGWGKKEDQIDYSRTISKIIREIISEIIGPVDKEYRVIREAILELAIDNEFYTRFSGKSSYDEGNKTISLLKKQIYPYWLMYLGVKPEDFMSYMIRDNVAFEMDKYTYERELKKVNLKEFIDFCIRNKKIILRFYPQIPRKPKEASVTAAYPTEYKVPKQEEDYATNREPALNIPLQQQQLEII